MMTSVKSYTRCGPAVEVEIKFGRESKVGYLDYYTRKCNLAIEVVARKFQGTVFTRERPTARRTAHKPM